MYKYIYVCVYLCMHETKIICIYVYKFLMKMNALSTHVCVLDVYANVYLISYKYVYICKCPPN